MKKGSLLILSAVIAVSAWLACGDAAQAKPPYKLQWEAKYVKKNSTVPAEQALATAAEAAKCNICHVGKSKKDRNAYGKELAKFLMKGDEKDVAKIQKALADVEVMHSKADDPTSPTFGDLMKQGKLPGGN